MEWATKPTSSRMKTGKKFDFGETCPEYRNGKFFSPAYLELWWNSRLFACFSELSAEDREKNLSSAMCGLAFSNLYSRWCSPALIDQTTRERERETTEKERVKRISFHFPRNLSSEPLNVSNSQSQLKMHLAIAKHCEELYISSKGEERGELMK